MYYYILNMLRYKKCQVTLWMNDQSHMMTIIEGYGDVIVVNTFMTVEYVHIWRRVELLTILFTDKWVFLS